MIRQATNITTIASEPAWLLGKGLSYGVAAGPTFPRLIDFDEHRADAGASLPADRFGLLWSTDHSSSTGFWGLATSDSIDGTFTDSGAEVFEDTQQGEMAHPVWDAANNRWVVIYHKNTSAVTYGNQQAYYVTTDDFVTFSSPVALLDVGHHTGYPWVNESGTRMLCGWTGAEGFLRGVFTATDPTNWTLDHIQSSNQNHIVGKGSLHGAAGCFVTIDSVNYLITTLEARPRLGANVPSKIIAIPYTSDWKRPTGGYLTLHTYTGSGDETTGGNYIAVYNVDGTPWMFYASVGADGKNRIRRASLTGAPAQQTAPAAQLQSTGEFQRGSVVADARVFDATAESSPPSGFEVDAITGADQSSSQGAAGYRVESAANGSVSLQTTAAVDPLSYETVEIVYRGLTAKTLGTVANLKFQLGLVDALPSVTDGILVFFADPGGGDGATRPWGNVFFYDGGSVQTEEAGYLVSYNESNSSNQPSNFNRAAGYDLTVRIGSYGTTLAILVNDSVAFYDPDITDRVDWSTSLKPFIRATGSGGDAMWVQLTAMEVRQYNGEIQNSILSTDSDTIAAIKAGEIDAVDFTGVLRPGLLNADGTLKDSIKSASSHLAA